MAKSLRGQRTQHRQQFCSYTPLKAPSGHVTTTDPDSGDSFKYKLLSGDGDLANGRFTVKADTGELSTNEVFDFETAALLSVRIGTTDSGGNTFEKIFAISVTNANDAPTDLALDNSSVMEGTSGLGGYLSPQTWTLGTCSPTTVSGTGDTGNSQFVIEDDILSSLWSGKLTLSVRIEVADQGGGTFRKVHHFHDRQARCSNGDQPKWQLTRRTNLLEPR